MRILLTNDDGIDAGGLAALRERLAPFHEVTVVAPAFDRSGSSHSVTVGRDLTARETGPRTWSLDGTPADCARLGIQALCGSLPDALVSGVNHGPNLGTDILLSGTVGAARQAAMMGIPALAVSCLVPGPRGDPGYAAWFVAANLERLVPLIRPGRFLNINAPVRPGGASVVRPGREGWIPSVRTIEADDGSVILRTTYEFRAAAPDSFGDWAAAADGSVLLTSMGLWGWDRDLDEELRPALPFLSLQEDTLTQEVGPGALFEEGRPRLQME